LRRCGNSCLRGLLVITYPCPYPEPRRLTKVYRVKRLVTSRCDRTWRRVREAQGCEWWGCTTTMPAGVATLLCCSLKNDVRETCDALKTVSTASLALQRYCVGTTAATVRCSTHVALLYPERVHGMTGIWSSSHRSLGMGKVTLHSQPPFFTPLNPCCYFLPPSLTPSLLCCCCHTEGRTSRTQPTADPHLTPITTPTTIPISHDPTRADPHAVTPALPTSKKTPPPRCLLMTRPWQSCACRGISSSDSTQPGDPSTQGGFA
jgi:hypothetical protein